MTIEDFDEQQRRAREAFSSGVRMALNAIPYATNRQERSRRLGVSINTVDNWTKGASFPNDFHLYKLSMASGWPVECIREGRIPDRADVA